MQEFVRLGQDLRNQGVFVKILDVEHLSVHLVAVVSCLVNICKKIFVLKIKSPVLLEVVRILVILRRESCSLHLLHVDSSHFGRRDGAWSERDWLLLIKSPTANRSIIEVDLVSWTSPEAMGR